MPIVPLHGHAALREQLISAAQRGTLPASLLLAGPRGVGKQRLALWLGQYLLCVAPSADGPCGHCRQCRFAAELTHPDLQWFFPRPRLKESDATPQAVREDLAEAIAERVLDGGLYVPPSGSEGIYIATVRAIVQSAAMSAALARKKVFIVGDADRMISQEGADQAANAFLKLLEEPPADTQLILTTSEPGALLPTIRSRVATVRVALVPDVDVRAFVEEPAVAARLDVDGGAAAGVSKKAGSWELVKAAAGAPGRLFDLAGWSAALDAARQLVSAARDRNPAARYRLAFLQASTKARGSFSDTLDALTVVLHERTRESAVRRTDEVRALTSSVALACVERAKELAQSNVSPQLVTASLLRDLAGLLQ